MSAVQLWLHRIVAAQQCQTPAAPRRRRWRRRLALSPDSCEFPIPWRTEGCRKLLLEFTDRDGRSLQDRLTSLGVDFDQYASLLVLYDGTRFPLCERGAVAFTAPGSRVVHVCVAQLKQSSVSQPELLTALLIHEILHTLGLGEDPPSSSEITRRVLARCGGNEGSR
jgi:predicted Zn-dependent protease with MMP-like domain